MPTKLLRKADKTFFIWFPAQQTEPRFVQWREDEEKNIIENKWSPLRPSHLASHFLVKSVLDLK